MNDVCCSGTCRLLQLCVLCVRPLIKKKIYTGADIFVRRSGLVMTSQSDFVYVFDLSSGCLSVYLSMIPK